jgi:adenine-specific DNA-methyltransferase
MQNNLTIKRDELLKKIGSIKKMIISNNLNNETEELISILNELKREVEINATKKFGLVWDKEHTKEKVVEDCENYIPILKRDNTKTVSFGKTNNILIEGDNYHALSSLSFILQNSIDVIYIDPPYNTGARDWKYNNDYVDSEDGYKHSKWISMMDKRLRLARKLLKNTGIIVCSIDHHELFQLGMLMDDIFGEENRIGIVSVVHKPEGRNQEKFFGTSNEFALFYAKNKNTAQFQQVSISDDVALTFNKTDSDGRRYRDNEFMRKNRGTGGVDTSLRINKPNFWYPIYVSKDLKKLSLDYFEDSIEVYPIAKNGVEKAWRTLKEEFDKRNKQGLMYAIEKDGKINIYEKYYENEVIKTHWIDKKYNAVMYGTKILTEILGPGIFNFPKSLYLMKDILKITAPKNAVVLDFFAGSGTTGHAVLELNKEDGGSRKFILCTNNENKICEDVTYPRLKTVITGRRPDGTKYSDGIPANLYYFKTTFIEDHVNSEQVKYNLVEKVDSLLCIAENIFELVERNEYSSHFVSENRHLFIYSDYYSVAKFTEFKNRVLRAQGEKIVYIYSSDNSVDETLFEGTDIQVKPIPSKIYEIYREIVEGIKRGE